MRPFFLFFSSAVLLGFLISIVGCSRDELAADESVIDGFIVRELTVSDIGIDILENEYAPFTTITTVWVYGSLRDSCQSLHETRSWVEADTINIKITTKEPVVPDECTPEAVNLLVPVHVVGYPYSETGEYKVIVNGVEKEFRINS